MTDAGVNGIQSVDFQTSRLKELRAQARQRAVLAAQEKAENYCQAAGINLGQIIHNVVTRFCQFADISQNNDGRTSLEQRLSISDFIKIYYQQGIDGMADNVYHNRQRTSTRSGILKSEAVLRFSEILAQFGVEYPEDVANVRGNEAFEGEIKKIPGQKSGISLKYF